MAQRSSHLSISVILAILYAGIGLSILGIHPEHVLLASVIVVVAGLLPNIDSDPGAGTAREFGALLAAAAPLLLIEFFPIVKAGGVARIALVVICCYLISRLIVVRILEYRTEHRGLIHSVPAAIITSEAIYLLFWDLFAYQRAYLAGAALLGYLSHLVLDASSNIDLLGKKEKKPPALKLKGPSWQSTFMMYSVSIVLGWLVVRDIYPQFRIYAGFKF